MDSSALADDAMLSLFGIRIYASGNPRCRFTSLGKWFAIAHRYEPLEATNAMSEQQRLQGSNPLACLRSVGDKLALIGQQIYNTSTPYICLANGAYASRNILRHPNDSALSPEASYTIISATKALPKAASVETFTKNAATSLATMLHAL